MAEFLNDSFTETSTTLLSSHTPEVGGAWVQHPNYTTPTISVIGGTGYATGSSTSSTAIYYNDQTPGSADYHVEVVLDRAETANVQAGPLGRVSSSANTFYQLFYNTSSNVWVMERVLAGSSTSLGSYAMSFTAGTPITARLSMVGTAIKAIINGVERISATDSGITAAGFAGVRTRSDGRLLSVVAVDDTVAPTTPNPPTGTTVSGITTTGFTVSWTDASSDETGFKVQTSPSPYTTWTAATTTAANATSYVVTGLSDNVTYKARVASTNANGDSAWVESGTITTQALTKLRPNADTTVGTATSTGANLFGVLDETVADDADYITIPGTLSSVSLVQGHPSETNIKTWTPSPGASFATETLTMTSGEASAITDYSALYLKIVTSSTTVKLKFENSTDPGDDTNHSLAIRLRAA